MQFVKAQNRSCSIIPLNAIHLGSIDCTPGVKAQSGWVKMVTMHDNDGAHILHQQPAMRSAPPHPAQQIDLSVRYRKCKRPHTKTLLLEVCQIFLALQLAGPLRRRMQWATQLCICQHLAAGTCLCWMLRVPPVLDFHPAARVSCC